MQKKAIYLFFCLLCSTGLHAQPQNAVDRLLAHIKSMTFAIIKDSNISTPCKKEIKEFQNAIPTQNKIKLSKDVVQKLLNSAQLFTGSINEAFNKKCGIKLLDQLVDSANELMVELDKVDTDDVIKIKITGNGATGWMLATDSISNSIGKLVIKDSLGHILALLYPNSKSPARLILDKSNLNDSSFKIIQDQNKLISIQLPLRSDSGGSVVAPSHVKDNIEAQLNSLHSQNTVLLITIAILFFLILATGFLYFRELKKFRSSFQQGLGFSNELQTSQLMEEIKNDAILVPPPDLTEPLVKEEILAEQDTDVPPDASKDACFICEIMMTAGPRKKPMSDPDSDKDLGEDVCGFISTTKEIFTWLLDGTSDDDSWKDPVTKKEYFSSRLLAQSIGDRLRNSFIVNGPGALVVMIGGAIDEVKQNWLQIIDQLPEEEKERLKNRIQSKISPQCSTTALIGHLKSNGDLSACRTGDSQLFLFGGLSDKRSYLETPLMGKSENGVDRIFFRLQLNVNQEFEIVSNKPVFDVAEEKNVDTIISFSDGIGLATELLLKEQYKNDPVKVKQSIIYQLQGTGDDKSICFIERR